MMSDSSRTSLKIPMAVFFDSRDSSGKAINKAPIRAAMMQDNIKLVKGYWEFPSAELLNKYVPGAAKAKAEAAAATQVDSVDSVEGPMQPEPRPVAVSSEDPVDQTSDPIDQTSIDQTSVLIEPEVAPETASASEELKAALENSRRRLVLEPSGWWFISTSVPSKGWIPTKKRKSLEKSVEFKPMNGTTASVTTETMQRTIIAPEEYKRCQSTVGRLANRLRTMGKPIATNIIAVPLSRIAEFKGILGKCQQILQAFNKETSYHEIELTVYEMVIATSSEAQMAADVTKEIQRLLSDMREALDSCDVASIKAVAAKAEYKAKTLAASSAQSALSGAVAAAKKAMSTMKKEITKKGASVEETKRLLADQFKAVDSARMTFLEFDVGEVTIDADAAAEAKRFLTLELDDEPEVEPGAPTESASS